MPPTTSFTPQKVINTARLRSPALTSLVLDDTALVDDYNHMTKELMTHRFCFQQTPTWFQNTVQCSKM